MSAEEQPYEKPKILVKMAFVENYDLDAVASFFRFFSVRDFLIKTRIKLRDIWPPSMF